MTKPIFRIPFIGLVVKVILLCATTALIILCAVLYISYTSLSTSVEDMRISYADSRSELMLLENDIDKARSRVEKLLDKEESMRAISQDLKEQAMQLERDWEVVKVYKRRIEESGKEIEKIRQRIRSLGK